MTTPDNVKTTVELPRALYQEVRHRAVDQGTNVRAIMILALRDYLRATELPADAVKVGR